MRFSLLILLLFQVTFAFQVQLDSLENDWRFVAPQFIERSGPKVVFSSASSQVVSYFNLNLTTVYLPGQPESIAKMFIESGFWDYHIMRAEETARRLEEFVEQESQDITISKTGAPFKIHKKFDKKANSDEDTGIIQKLKNFIRSYLPSKENSALEQAKKRMTDQIDSDHSAYETMAKEFLRKIFHFEEMSYDDFDVMFGENTPQLFDVIKFESESDKLFLSIKPLTVRINGEIMQVMFEYVVVSKKRVWQSYEIKDIGQVRDNSLIKVNLPKLEVELPLKNGLTRKSVDPSLCTKMQHEILHCPTSSYGKYCSSQRLHMCDYSSYPIDQKPSVLESFKYNDALFVLTNAKTYDVYEKVNMQSVLNGTFPVDKSGIIFVEIPQNFMLKVADKIYPGFSNSKSFTRKPINGLYSPEDYEKWRDSPDKEDEDPHEVFRLRYLSSKDR